jgi:hypothetical protein
MSYPDDVSTRIVYGSYTKVSGVPASGTVSFTASSRVLDENDTVLLSGPIALTLDANGEFQ